MQLGRIWDYECPSCGEAQPISKSSRAHFGDQLSFVFRNFRLREIHPWAERAAVLAEFAGTLDKFWEMHALLFKNQESLSESMFQALLREVDLTDSGLQDARADGVLKKKVGADFLGGIRSGVNGTPTFFLNGDRYDGPTDYGSLAAVVEQVLISNGD